MKQNRSLAISTMIEECQNKNIIGLLHDAFPAESLRDMSIKPTRDRVFNPITTLLIMVLTSTQQDKTLKNAVDLYYGIHQNIGKSLRQEVDSEFKDYLDNKSPQVGRPRQKAIPIAISKEKNISLNTAAYSKARKRLPLEMTQQLFASSKIPKCKNSYSHWHGRTVLIGDGTYVQLQDTDEIKEEFSLQENGKDTQGYPKAIIVGVVERGSGQLFSYDMSNRDVSELEVFHKLIDQLPAGSVVLLDDLYNCYEIFAKCIRNNIDVIVPSKRKRYYEVVKKLNDYDEIIKIKAPKSRSKWVKELTELPPEIELRQITCKSPEGKEYKLHSTITDEKIPAYEYQTIYMTRWDIEISIREVKTIMHINILRSKTPDMAKKELMVTLATYNLIRKIIYESISDIAFFPEEDFIHKFYTLNKNILIDKKGRVYSRWSTGRKRIKGVIKGGDTS